MSISVARIDEVRSDQLSLIGGKAASLARLRSLGFPVPDAYVFPVGALAGVSSCKIELSLNAILKALPPPWIVRSSANVEDSDAAAFAGVFRTVLGLDTVPGVARAIAVVLASAREGAARGYVRQLGISPKQIGMAVVVQHMLRPFASGVAFTRHPLDGRHVTVIEATYGLGASLVDGQVEPDFVEVDLQGRVSFIRIGSKRRMTVFDGGNTKVVDVEEEERLRPAISYREARELATLAARVEVGFGTPQDIEWAIEGGRLSLVQTRPITRLS